jgi:hypothetical protein
MKTYKQIQEEEAKTWLEGDADKKQREIIRYPLIKKQMGLDYLDTSNMFIADVGAGPFGGISSVLKSRGVVRIDPLRDDYAKIADVTSYSSQQAEDFNFSNFDLVMATNAIDHFESPTKFMVNLVNTMKSGAYFAHLHAIDNAISHPHPAHVHNINPEFINKYLDNDFECVWYLDYKNDNLIYGWRKQPAFAGLYRKVTGYK